MSVRYEPMPRSRTGGSKVKNRLDTKPLQKLVDEMEGEHRLGYAEPGPGPSDSSL